MANQFILNSVLALSLASSTQAWAGNAGMGKHAAHVATAQQQAAHTVTGQVTDEKGEPLIGVSILIKGTSKGTVTDIDGNFKLPVDNKNAVLVFSYIGYTAQEVNVQGRPSFNVVMKEEGRFVKEVVVTAMGIQRKESSLTYATQRVKAEDLMKVQDPNVANSLEGKISGITITPNAGGAGGASKIMLRGNKSIMGNSSPLIVVDGVPMTNNTRGRKDGIGTEGFGYGAEGEGSDPLSMINPDDIESMNVLKGANAAALYGSVAANGVVMITTKKGREGKLDINFTSNVTFDNPLLTPKFQRIYGADVDSHGFISDNAWGAKIANRANGDLTVTVPVGDEFFTHKEREVHLRNTAHDDVADFYRTGVTTNNSISLSGGTATSRSYFSVANSHATGMIEKNSYNRNTINFRQTFKFFDRLNVDATLNYVETVTRNRPGGGTVGNPIYHLYMTPGNVDVNYYKNNYVIEKGQWHPKDKGIFFKNKTVMVQDPVTGTATPTSIYQAVSEYAILNGPMQDWVYLSSANNNPYWLMNMNQNKKKESRLMGTFSGNIDLWAGFSFQARFKFEQMRYNYDSRTYATTFASATMFPYGKYWVSDERATELYTDYLLNYNKEHGDFSVSATAGFVGHTVKTNSRAINIQNATIYDNKAATMMGLPTEVNYFETNAGDRGVTSTSNGSNWDRAWLFTGQVGWKEKIYVDGSYRRDWYRPYKQFKLLDSSVSDNFGYFGIGANAIVSSLVKLPEWINYLKYRASYSEVGNSIPNIAYMAARENKLTNTSSGSDYNAFTPKDEKTKSFETGVEMLFLNDRLSFDFTYYLATMTNLYMPTSGGNGKTNVLNSARVRNSGFETTIGYDWKFGKSLRWKTSYNLSYNNNTILETAYDTEGKERRIAPEVAGARIVYKRGGSIGDIYVGDFVRDANGHYALTNSGRPQFDTTGKNDVYMGNMNSNWQMGWSNTFNYKDFQLFMLINGRVGGKVISLTEGYLDLKGLSQRTAEARMNAEANNIVAAQYGNVPGIVLPDGSGRIVPIQEYYTALAGSTNPYNYIYSATNFRLRELSLGYTFRDLLGQNKNLSVSFIARNLFFLYKDSPVDPDVSLSTANALGGFELFNMPSSRSYGFSLKLNF